MIPLPYADDIRDNKQILEAAGFANKPGDDL
jgi:ATP-dependent DNA helicase 2 subunit 1